MLKTKEKIIEEIKDLHKLHSVTKDFNHIIEYQPGSWKMFEPSKFIYSFFAFNSLYNYNWEKSINENKLMAFSMEEDLSESQKFKKMIDFIFEEFKDADSKEFVKIILIPDRKQNSKRKEERKKELIRSINYITPDSRIKESEREGFKKEFIKLLENETLLKGKLKNEILRFVYLVRNNIFHGTKTTIDMTDKRQRDRLNIYSSILIATNELLFKTLERKLDFKLDKKYKIQL